jgi:hypothetical protein
LSTISKHRIQNWLAFIFLGIGALLTAILGLFAHVRATATPLSTAGVAACRRRQPHACRRAGIG